MHRLGATHTPPPRFPHPPTRAFAVPTTSLVNMREVQYWHMTNVLPPKPMKNRRTASEVALLTRPVQAQGILAKHRMILMGILAPYLSQRGPLMNRSKMVPATEQIFEVQISFFVSPRVILISASSGAMANQMKNAVKLSEERGRASDPSRSM